MKCFFNILPLVVYFSTVDDALSVLLQLCDQFLNIDRLIEVIFYQVMFVIFQNFIVYSLQSFFNFLDPLYRSIEATLVLLA